LYIDKEDFLSQTQIDRLNGLKYNLNVKKCDKLSWGGEHLIMTELEAFKEISEEISPESYIAKVDSDIFFISDKIFLEVVKSGDSLIGQLENYWAPFVYVQGGCYFLKSSLASKLIDYFNENTCLEVLQKLNNETARSKNRSLSICPEDATIHFLSKMITDKISFKSFFGDYSKRFKGCVIHFKTKDEMLAFDRLYLK
jgi:hypothetical protein